MGLYLMPVQKATLIRCYKMTIQKKDVGKEHSTQKKKKKKVIDIFILINNRIWKIIGL